VKESVIIIFVKISGRNFLTSSLQQELGKSPHSRPGHSTAGDHRIVPQSALPFTLDGLCGSGLRVVRGSRLYARQTDWRRGGIGDGWFLW